MPITEYYHGHGGEVLAAMIARYGEKKGKQVFYATANKRHQNPEDQDPRDKLARRYGSQTK